MKHTKIKKWFIQGLLFSVCTLSVLQGAARRAFADDTWASKTSMSTARYLPGVGVVNGTLYAVGGNNGNSNLATVEAYEPATDTWVTKSPMPTARHGLAVGVASGKLYAVGGTNVVGTSLATVEAYDPVTDTWTTKSPMPTARYGLAIGVVNGILYAVGGYSGDDAGVFFATVEAYNPVTDTWTTKTPMPTPRYGATVGVVNETLHAIGGHNQYSGLAAITTVEAYDPGSNTWTTKASMPTARYALAGGVVNDIIYAIGGIDYVTALAALEAYDPASNTWTAKASMPTARYGFAGGVLNGILYAVGGSGAPGRLATVEAYTARTNLPPTAEAGTDQEIHAGQTVTLNGNGSYDDNTASALLQYAWSFYSKPPDSIATLINPNTPNPSFVADKVGTYIVRLSVTDQGGLSSTADDVTISSTNILPTANAGTAQAKVAGNTVTLDGAGSSDPNGDPLTYTWNFVATPPGIVAPILTGAATSAPSFTPSFPGQYTVGLVVSDGFGSSPQAQVIISVIAAQDYAQNRTVDALNYVAAMTPAQFQAPGHKKSFSNFLTQAIAALQAGDIVEAKLKLNAALSRTDGFPVRGAVDGNGPGMDWITNPAAQTAIYQALSDALSVL